MRILVVHHVPLDSDEAGDNDEPGSQAQALARSLQAAGHQPRILTISEQETTDNDLPTVSVIASQDDPTADLPFPVPRFTSTGRGDDFCGISTPELDLYRQVLRRRLDHEVHQFNPHVIHCQHIWVWAHLALESGVPYVATAHAEELDALARDPRYVRLAHQAAENAGRILVADKDLANRVEQTFHVSGDRVLVVSPSAATEIIAAYRAVLRDRGVATAEE